MITPHAKSRTLAVIIAGLMPVGANAITIPVAADTVIDNTTSAKGFAPALIIRGTNKALMRFDLSQLPPLITADKIEKATLYIYVTKLGRDPAPQLKIIQLTGTEKWAERTANKGTVIPLANPPLTTLNLLGSLKLFVPVDLTATVRSWLDKPLDNNGIALVLDGFAQSTLVLLDSKEATATGNSAYLEIVLTDGSVGPTGAPGPTGATGAPGPTGAPGANGLDGPVGPTGPVGPAGANGLNGPIGPTGATGADGIQGPTGATGSFENFNFNIGDTGPGGGIIFFVDHFHEYAGFTYLEAAPEDLGGTGATGPWCDSGPGSTGPVLNPTGLPTQKVGNGHANTLAIDAAGCTNSVATAVLAYPGPQNTNDWFIPSLGELKLLFTNLSQAGLGGFDSATGIYWSSSEFGDGSTAYYLDIQFDSINKNSKSNSYVVRPIRYVP